MGAGPTCTAGPKQAEDDMSQYDAGSYNLDDPKVLGRLVATSWGKIPQERPPMPAGADPQAMSQQMPVTFDEMFAFNCGVMVKPDGPDMKWAASLGLGIALGTVVESVTNRASFKTECNNLAKRIGSSTGVTGPGLDEFKRIMITCLRSLLPRDWNTEQEIAWSWFWDSVSICIEMKGELLASLVQASWGKLATVEPPCPEGGDPTKQVPVTFAGMASFNNMILQQTGGSNMEWLPELYALLGTLVDTLNTEKYKGNCEMVAAMIKSKGATAQAAKEFKTVLIATMRSMLPREWSPQLESAWGAFWDGALENICPKL